MLPFFGAGIGLISLGAKAMQRHEANAFAPLLAGVLFTGFSVSILAVVFTATRIGARSAALRAAAPDQPWLWRPEWSAKRIPDRGSAKPILLWVFAIFWNAMALPLVFMLAQEWPKQRNPLLLFALIFPAVGLALIVIAIYAGLRRLKFGLSACTIDNVPLRPGHTFHGEIAMRGDAVPEDGYHLTLACVHRVSTGQGKSRSIEETPLWKQETRVSAASARRDPAGGVRVPFSMTIPPDARPSDFRNDRDQIVWRLDAAAEMPGVDYAASFELPVF